MGSCEREEDPFELVQHTKKGNLSIVHHLNLLDQSFIQFTGSLNSNIIKILPL